MKKVFSIVGAIVIAGSVAVWKSIDSKVIKQTDEVLTGVFKKSKKVNDKGKVLVQSSTKVINKSKLSVSYSDFTFIKNGVKETIKVPDFSKHSVFRAKLPDNLLIAKDEIQFSNSLQSLRKELISNKEKALSQLRLQNSAMLKRDREVLKANEKAINEAEDRMLVATKAGNLEEQKILLKKLRSLTKDITFIQTPKGKVSL